MESLYNSMRQHTTWKWWLGESMSTCKSKYRLRSLLQYSVTLQTNLTFNIHSKWLRSDTVISDTSRNGLFLCPCGFPICTSNHKQNVNSGFWGPEVKGNKFAKSSTSQWGHQEMKTMPWWKVSPNTTNAPLKKWFLSSGISDLSLTIFFQYSKLHINFYKIEAVKWSQQIYWNFSPVYILWLSLYSLCCL